MPNGEAGAVVVVPFPGSVAPNKLDVEPKLNTLLLSLVDEAETEVDAKVVDAPSETAFDEDAVSPYQRRSHNRMRSNVEENGENSVDLCEIEH